MSEVTCKSGLTDKEKSVVFWASFLALFAASAGFVIKVLTLGRWQDEFGLTGQEAGAIFGHSLWPIAVTMILFSLIVDVVGYKISIYIACALQAAAVLLSIAAKDVNMLIVGSICAGLGHGVVEAVINPACSSMYTDDKSTKLNILHAAWPAGMVFAAVPMILIGVAPSSAGVGMVEGSAGWSWRMHNWWMMIPVVIYGIMFLKAKFPVDERVEAKIPYSAMLKEVGFLGAFISITLLFYQIYLVTCGFTGAEVPSNLLVISVAVGAIGGALFGAYTKGIGKPMFFILCVVMIPLATTELGTDAWIKQLMIPQMGEEGSSWAIVFSAFIMMFLRFFAGALLHRFNPAIVLCISSVFSMLGLIMLAKVSGGMVFVAFVFYAVGQTFYWPTVLGLVSEQYPKGGALTLNTVSAIGLLSVGIIGAPIMGAFYDSHLSKNVKEVSTEIHATVEKKAKIFTVEYSAVDAAKAEKAAKAAGLEEKFKDATDQAGRGALMTTALAFPMSMLLVFIGIAAYFKSKGGYKPVQLVDESNDDDEDGNAQVEPVTA